MKAGTIAPGGGHEDYRLHVWYVGSALAVSTALAALSATPFVLYVINSVLLAAIGASALNLLMGVAGQVSIGNAAFLAVGAFAAVALNQAGVPFPLDVISSGFVAAVAGLVIGLPALRIQGLYLVLATLAAHFIIIDLLRRFQVGAVGEAGFRLRRTVETVDQIGRQRLWLVILALTVMVVVICVKLLLKGKVGRAWMMIRTNELTAAALGVDVTRYKLGAFAVSSAVIGVQGGLTAHFSGVVIAEQFPLSLAIAYIAMIVVGGMGTLVGPVVGAAIVVGVPHVLPWVLASSLGEDHVLIQFSPRIAHSVYGLLIVGFVTLSPRGVVGWVYRARMRVLTLRGSKESPSSGDAVETVEIDQGRRGPHKDG